MGINTSENPKLNPNFNTYSDPTRVPKSKFRKEISLVLDEQKFNDLINILKKTLLWNEDKSWNDLIILLKLKDNFLLEILELEYDILIKNEKIDTKKISFANWIKNLIIIKSQ